jgi:hypothetical protein
VVETCSVKPDTLTKILSGGSEIPNKKIVYVAGPYSIGDQAENVRKAILMAERLIAEGFIPFIPHLSHLWQLMSPHKYEFWMELDAHYLLRCDALLRIPGESAGADREVELAKSKWIPVFYNFPDLIKGLTPENSI